MAKELSFRRQVTAMAAMEALQQKIGYEFENRELLVAALVPLPTQDNARNFRVLELLGDRAYRLAVTGQYYRLHPGCTAEDIHDCAERRATNNYLRSAMRVNELYDLFTFSKNWPHGRHTEDVVEAFVGALYVDGGYGAAEKFVLKNFYD